MGMARHSEGGVVCGHGTRVASDCAVCGLLGETVLQSLLLNPLGGFQSGRTANNQMLLPVRRKPLGRSEAILYCLPQHTSQLPAAWAYCSLRLVLDTIRLLSRTLRHYVDIFKRICCWHTVENMVHKLWFAPRCRRLSTLLVKGPLAGFEEAVHRPLHPLSFVQNPPAYQQVG